MQTPHRVAARILRDKQGMAGIFRMPSKPACLPLLTPHPPGFHSRLPWTCHWVPTLPCRFLLLPSSGPSSQSPSSCPPCSRLWGSFYNTNLNSSVPCSPHPNPALRRRSRLLSPGLLVSQDLGAGLSSLTFLGCSTQMATGPPGWPPRENLISTLLCASDPTFFFF